MVSRNPDTRSRLALGFRRRGKERCPANHVALVVLLRSSVEHVEHVEVGLALTVSDARAVVVFHPELHLFAFWRLADLSRVNPPLPLRRLAGGVLGGGNSLGQALK